MIWRLAALLFGAIAFALAVPVWRHLREVGPAPSPAVRASFTVSGAELGSGDDLLDAAISRDGRDIVFVATTAGVARLWRRPLDGERANAIAGTDGAMWPTWKWGGGVVAFFADRKLRQVALADGAVQDLADAPRPGGAAWMPDGSLLYSAEPGTPIQRLRHGNRSDATTLRPGDVAHLAPEAANAAGHFVYVAQVAGGRRVVRLVRGDDERELGRTSGHATLLGDTLLTVLDGALSAQRFDGDLGRLSGRAVRLAFGVGVSAGGRAFFAASPRVIVWAASSPRVRELRWFDAVGRNLDAIAEPGDYWQVRLAPDDRSAAVTAVDPLLRTLDVFVHPAAGTSLAGRRVTLSLSADSDPVWAPDGSRLAFRSMQGGRPNVFARPPQFSNAPDEVIARSELDETPSDWRIVDGRATLLIHAASEGAGLDVWAVNLADGSRHRVTRSAFNESDARWSPGGRMVAYSSDEPGQAEIFVEPWPQDGRRWRATSAGGSRPRWRRDGQGLYFLRDGALMSTTWTQAGLEVLFSPAVSVGDVRAVRDFDVSRRSDRLLVIRADARPVQPGAGIIVNWASLQ